MYKVDQLVTFRGNVGTVVEVLENAVVVVFSNGAKLTVLFSELQP